MAYFPNGSAGQFFQEHQCFKCRNWKKDDRGIGCAVWDLHLFHNGKKEYKEIFDFLIPEKDCEYGDCRMFLKKKEVEKR